MAMRSQQHVCVPGPLIPHQPSPGTCRLSAPAPPAPTTTTAAASTAGEHLPRVLRVCCMRQWNLWVAEGTAFRRHPLWKASGSHSLALVRMCCRSEALSDGIGFWQEDYCAGARLEGWRWQCSAVHARVCMWGMTNGRSCEQSQTFHTCSCAPAPKPCCSLHGRCGRLHARLR